MRQSALPVINQRVALVVREYPRDTVYNFGNLYCKQKRVQSGATRGRISQFSPRSRRRARLVMRNIVDRMTMELTLTYPDDYPTDGTIVKRHFRAFKEWLRRRRVGIFWMMEFQERGAPHFHAALTHPVLRDRLLRAWYKIVGSGDPKHLRHGVHCEFIRDHYRLASYYTEYMLKLEQKTVPVGYENVGRFWGYTARLLTCKIHSFHGNIRDLSRLLRGDRRRYIARCRGWGFRWKWKGTGWIEWDARPPDKAASQAIRARNINEVIANYAVDRASMN